MRAREFTEPQAAGCIIVAADTGRWCLQQRSNSVTDPGVWSTWGGGRESGESVPQCVRREMAEESGYSGPVRLEPIDSNSMYATFLAHVPHEFEPRLNSESQDYQWSDPEDLPRPLHPGLEQTLGQLLESAAQYHEIEFRALNESLLYIDVPNEEWLQDKIDYVKRKGRNSFGVPYLGSTTARPTDKNFRLPVSLLKRLPGMRAEQQNVRSEDLKAIMKIMKDTGKLPLMRNGVDEYRPFINVAWNGEAWVNEGNHRIMAAAALGWDSLPVELSYFDGGERVESGPLYPPKIGLGDPVNENFADGKKPGRKGLAKRMGVNCKQSVSKLRKIAKNSSGERQRMAHWCANMKSGRNK